MNALDRWESWYNAAAIKPQRERSMSDKMNDQKNSDGMADAGATIAIITIVVITMYVWLSGMPA